MKVLLIPKETQWPSTMGRSVHVHIRLSPTKGTGPSAGEPSADTLLFRARRMDRGKMEETLPEIFIPLPAMCSQPSSDGRALPPCPRPRRVRLLKMGWFLSLAAAGGVGRGRFAVRGQ